MQLAHPHPLLTRPLPSHDSLACQAACDTGFLLGLPWRGLLPACVPGAYSPRAAPRWLFHRAYRGQTAIGGKLRMARPLSARTGQCQGSVLRLSSGCARIRAHVSMMACHDAIHVGGAAEGSKSTWTPQFRRLSTLWRKRGCRASAGLTLGAITTGTSKPKHSVRRPSATESSMPTANLFTVLRVAGAPRTRAAGGQVGEGFS